MLDPDLIHSLPKLAPPVLTVYLDTNPAKPSNQGRTSGAEIWLKSQAKDLLTDVPREERKTFLDQLQRVERFLEGRAKRERGIVFFAGPQAWHVLRLQVDTENEIHWGRPSMTQLLWLLDEHQPCGVVLVDRSGVRFYRFWMGEVEEQKSARFEIDTSQWRKKSLVRPRRPGGQTTRSAEREAFARRLDAYYARMFREAARRIERWARREQLTPVFVVGAPEAIDPVWTELSPDFKPSAAALPGIYSARSPVELQERLGPEIARWRRTREAAQVAEILEARAESMAVTGVDETLRALQEGRVRSVLVTRRVRGRVKQCETCGWTDRAADPICPMCGGKRRMITLREVLPELLRKFGVPVEVVAGGAGRRLRTVGGMGGWLRT